MAEITGLNIAHWAIGYGHNTDIHFLKLDLVDGNSITIALRPKQAEEIAQVLLSHASHPPLKPSFN
jgi:hypothetical protein